MLSFRVGGAVSRSLASTTVEDIYVSGGLEVRGGTSEIYRGYSTLPRREEEAGESRTSVHGRERVAYTKRVRKAIFAKQKAPQVHRHLCWARGPELYARRVEENQKALF